MTVTKNWISILPAIPLAHAVPFVRIPRSGRMSDLPIRRGIVFGETAFIMADLGGEHVYPSRHPTPINRGNQAQENEVRQFVRVDLDDPQGFAYALRWLMAQPEYPAPVVPGGLHGLINGSMIGHTSDADRLALAQAIADVQEQS
jgi:hypothetical protein